ncbi:hypothetical protein [Oceanivirga miroungae]|uniref:Uncharacterized protein n=1 Tax=Oceanivirga miroungae TaxID=1130046 RepID=A0A6I8M645_9FUSO|nr:hypothetical protein [Oceanivirga miroungae]VWL84821.1 hypothetical protein OMES3154_00075 [Oceanivirga miroungae]
MDGIKKINEYAEIYSVDKVWKKINEKKPIIYKNTNIKLQDSKIIVYVNDNTIENVLIEYKSILLDSIKKEIPDIRELEIVKVREKIKKPEDFKKEIKKNSENKIDKLKILKFYEESLKEYEKIEDENLKNIYVAYKTQAKITKYIMKSKNAILCNVCSEYFLPVEDEKECILCENRRYKEELSYIKSKIYKDNLLTKEYAKKIYNISETSYEKAKAEILDELMQMIYIKIDETIRIERKTEINLDSELDKYASYYINSDDEDIKDSFKKRAKARIKENIKKIYEKTVDVY